MASPQPPIIPNANQVDDPLPTEYSIWPGPVSNLDQKESAKPTQNEEYEADETSEAFFPRENSSGGRAKKTRRASKKRPSHKRVRKDKRKGKRTMKRGAGRTRRR